MLHSGGTAHEVEDVCFVRDFNIVGNPGQAVFFRLVVRVESVADDFGHCALLAVRTCASLYKVGAHGFPKFDGVDTGFTNGCANAAGGTSVNVILEFNEFFFRDFFGTEKGCPKAVGFVDETLPAVDFVARGKAGLESGTFIGRTPFGTLAAAHTAVKFHELNSC